MLKENPSTSGDARMLAEQTGCLDDFVWESGAEVKGMHLWSWMLQIPNTNSPTTILHTIRTNIQYAIIVAKKVISHVIVV